MSTDLSADGKLARRGVPLIDGVDKVTGRARYTADLDHAGALVGRILRSPVSHGDIVRLDVSKARALEGVFAVITGDDCPHTYGVLPVAMNEYPLARGRVRYRGEPIAAVAAIDAETAEQALALIEFEINKLPAYYTSEEARAPGAVLLHDNKPGNLEREVHHEFGDVGAGFASADLVREEKFSCAEINHAQIEPHASLCEYDPADRTAAGADRCRRSPITCTSCSRMPRRWTSRASASSSPSSAAASAPASRCSISRSSPRCSPAPPPAKCSCSSPARKPSSPIARARRPTSRSSSA